MLAILVEILSLFLLDVVAEIALELGMGALAHTLRGDKEANPAFTYIGLTLLGATVGLLVTLIFPERLLSEPPIKGLSLILSPIMTGLLMAWFGKWRRAGGHRTSALASFWGGFACAFAFSVTRWVMIEGLWS